MIGPIQLILMISVPVSIFILGYVLGKKSGYLKRVKEEKNV